MDAAAVAGAPDTRRGSSMRKRRKRLRPWPPRMAMQLHILRGSFSGSQCSLPQDVDVDAGLGDADHPGPATKTTVTMDPSVWGRLPDDITWRVLRFLPPVHRFQLHSVSRKWRHELTTSPHFCDCNQQQQQQVVVACASPGRKRWRCNREDNFKVVEVDQSFVPRRFWRFGSSTYSVVAAGDGLVCISNDPDPEHSSSTSSGRDGPPMASSGSSYCVLNPLTRTCVVLPPLPFHDQGQAEAQQDNPPLRLGWTPPAAGAVTAYRATPGARSLVDRRGTASKWEAATCDVVSSSRSATAPAAAGSPGRVAWSPVPAGTGPPVLAQCGGRTFLYRAGQLHVLGPAAADGAGPPRSAAVVVDGPSVALLGLKPARVGYSDRRSYLVAHRGAIFFVAQLMKLPQWTWESESPHPAHAAGVWRLNMPIPPPPPDGAGDGGTMAAWEAVSVLGVQQAYSLAAGDKCRAWTRASQLSAAFSVRHLLCCELDMSDAWRVPYGTPFVLGLDVDTGVWELVLCDLGMVREGTDRQSFRRRCATPFQVRPDLFL